MDNFVDGENTTKSETVLLQELIDNKRVYETEIDREKKTITIAEKVISYKVKAKLTDIYVALYTDGTLVFSSNESDIDTTKISEDGNYGNIKGKNYEWINIDEEPGCDITKMPPWFESSESIVKVSFLSEIVPSGIAYWFCYCESLTEIENINYLNTASATNMESTFEGCSSLATLDLSSFDTGNVTNMGGMFSGCSGLTSLNLSSFDTSNVTNMERMFFNSSSLTTLDLSSFNTNNVTDMKYMFFSCSSLATLNLSSFDTRNVTDISGMFSGCSGLTSLNLSSFDTRNVTYMGSMFFSCSSLTTLDLTSFDTRKVTDMSYMFSNCSSLITLDLTSFDTSNVTNVRGMFFNSRGLTNLDLRNFNTKKVTYYDMMFYGITTQITINNSVWNSQMTESATGYSGTFTI